MTTWISIAVVGLVVWAVVTALYTGLGILGVTCMGDRLKLSQFALILFQCALWPIFLPTDGISRYLARRYRAHRRRHR